MNRKQTSSAQVQLPPLLFPLPFSLRQAPRFTLNFTLCPLTLGFTHSPLCSSTHTCAHPPVPELTHPHLDSPTHTWAHTQAHPLTPRLIHSHPGSSTHTHTHLFTPMLTHSHPCSPTHTGADLLTPGLISTARSLDSA